jgi:FkbH-like protein
MTEKIKCVVWDLDNTLWTGIMAEGGSVTLKPGIKEVLETLDQRGILQSISSKNNYQDAVKKLEEYGIRHYFLYPQISWSSKAEAIKTVAEKLNISTNTFAFVDDDITEREEVKFSHPEVLVIDAAEYMNIVNMDRFIPDTITEDAKKRRLMYQSEELRKKEEESFTGSKEEFLKTLGLKLTVSNVTYDDLKRVEELTLRTHQLNSTGYTYSYEELKSLTDSKNHVFLSRPETVYPVYVDPTVTINATGSGSSKTILDTPIYNGSDVTNITAGANTSAVIGYVGTLNGVQYGSGRLLMRFPGLMNQSFMSDYNYTITAATLYMKEASGLSTSASIAAHMYTGPDWNESTTYSSSIWNGVYKRNGSEQPLSSYSFSYPNSTNGSFNITWAVKLWQSNPSMGTKGIMLKNETSESNGTYYKSLYTSEGSTKPYLSVTYAARTAASGAYLSYGLTTRTVTIRLVGTTTTNSTWSPIITASRNAWNNSGAGTNITTTTSGSSSHTLTVDAYPTQTWYGLMTPTVSGSTLTASTIQINTSTVGSTTEFRRSTVTHEMGHLFWLNDNPTTTDPCLMRHDRDREIVYVPQKIDIYHVQNQY